MGSFRTWERSMIPRENLEVVSVLGPLGAGKTTALNRLIEHVPSTDSYAVVVNDVGQQNIDARRIWDHPANRSERIIPLTAGCIGCSDVTQFRAALEQVHEAGVNVLFIEPTGIAPGTEIADVVRSSGFSLSVLTLVNAQTVARDMKWQVLPSQLAVANIIGITHIPEAHDDAAVMETVLEQLPVLPKDTSVELVKPDSSNYFRILASLRGMQQQLRVGSHVLQVCGCGHAHEHSHNHENHGISAKSFYLKPHVTVDEVARLLRPRVLDENNPLLRAKGTIGHTRFDLVGDEWTLGACTKTEQSTLTAIFGGTIPRTFLDEITELVEPVAPIEITGDKKTIVKSISTMPIEERVAIVQERVQRYPAPVSKVHGEIIPDCEADEGYELAFWGTQDDMPDTAKRSAMNAYIGFRLAGLHELLHHPEHVVNATEKTPYWLRRYGATLGYNGYYLENYIDRDLLMEIRDYNPAQLLIDGLLHLESLTFDEGRAEEKPEFIKMVMTAALSHNHVTRNDIARLQQHLLPLCHDNPAFTARWQSTFADM